MRCRKENGGFGTGHNTVLPELTSDYHFILTLADGKVVSHEHKEVPKA